MKWDFSDESQYPAIERELKKMLESGKYHSHNGVTPDSVEELKVRPNATAFADVYGVDLAGQRGRFRLILNLYSDGVFRINNCYKK